MARTSLTPIDMPTKFATDGSNLTWTAGDNTNGNDFPSTGREILLARNDDAGAQTVTVTSAADPYGRTGDISADSIPAGEYRVYQRFPQEGWIQTGGVIYVDVSAATVFLAVLRLPV